MWAPSVHNTQPWWFSARGQEISLHADAGRQLMVADPGGREMMISCGAALFTARLALRSLGHIPETCVLPDPAQPLLVARVSWQRRAAAAEYEQRLFTQVPRRRTHRGGFDPLPLAPDLLTVVATRVPSGMGQCCALSTAQGSRAVLAAAVETAEHAPAARQPLRSGTGQLGVAAGQQPARWGAAPAYPARAQRILPHFPGRDFAHGRRWGVFRSTPSAVPRSAGVVCLLTTTGDRPVDWVNAGQALQRILLTSASSEWRQRWTASRSSFPRLREFIRIQLSDGSYPQLVLRLGTVMQTAVSVRRPPPASCSQAAANISGVGYE